MTPIHFGTKRRFWLMRAAGGLGMAAISGMMARAAWASVGLWSPQGGLGLVGVTFFGVGAVVGIIEGTRRGPRLTLDAQGIHDRTLRVGVIEWADIVGAMPYGVARQPFVGLELRDPAKYVARTSPLMRLLVRVHRASGMPPFSVNLVGLDADPAMVAELIMAKCATDEPPLAD